MNIHKEFSIPIIQRPVDDSCILWISGRNRDSDVRIRDLSKYGNSANIIGAIWDINGINHSVLSFDGIDDYVNVADSSSLNPTVAIAIEAWVNATALGTAWMVSKRVTGLGSLAYALDTSSAGKPDFAVVIGGTSKAAVVANPLVVGVWTHLIGTYDGTNVKIYVDGVLGDTTPATGTIDIVAANVNIGAYGNDSRYYFNGPIDEVRIYNRALTAEEIIEHYQNTKHLFGF